MRSGTSGAAIGAFGTLIRRARTFWTFRRIAERAFIESSVTSHGSASGRGLVACDDESHVLRRVLLGVVIELGGPRAGPVDTRPNLVSFWAFRAGHTLTRHFPGCYGRSSLKL